jgi:hypothetical protein
MSLSVLFLNAEGFDASVLDLDNWNVQCAAMKGNLAAVAMLARKPQFIARAKTTDNTAASAVIDLTAQGLLSPAKSYRTIRVKSTAVNGTDSWTQEWEQVVYGNDGVTPKLLGSARLIRAVGQINGTVAKYGSVKYHGTTSGATVTNGADVDSGLSLGNFSSGVATLTVPISRDTTTSMRVESAHFSEDAGTIGDTRVPQVRAASTTTFTVNVATQNGTEALTDPNGTNNIDIGLFLLPPPSVAFAMASNNVTITAGYNTTDNVYHDIEVFIERADVHNLAPD